MDNSGQDEAEPQPFRVEDLALAEARLSAPEGISVAELQGLIREFDARPLSDVDLAAFREGRRPWKKFGDEVIPVAAYLSATAAPEARVRFPLDSEPPDAWLLAEDGKPAAGIEVTGALARSRVEIARRLRERKPVPGYLGLPDNASSNDYAAARGRERILQSRKYVDDSMLDGIAVSLGKKSGAKLPGQELLVVAPLHSSPDLDPESVRDALAKDVEALSFASVILIDPGRNPPIMLKLK